MSEGIVPTVLVERTVLYRTYSVLPVVAGRKVCTLDDTSAWEAEHTWLKLFERLCEILAHAVLMSLIRIHREERHVLQVSSHLRVAPYAQVRFVERLLSLERDSILLPLLARDVKTSVAYLLVVSHGSVLYKVNPYLGIAAVRHTSPHREAVLRVGLDTDAEEPLILYHSVLIAVARRSETHIVRILFERTVVLQRHLARDDPSGVVVGKFERAVLDELSVETAVSRIVDVFKEDSIHGRRDRSSCLRRVDVERVSLGVHASCHSECGKHR